MNKENEFKYREALLSTLTDSKVELVGTAKSKREYKPKTPSARYDEEKENITINR